MRITTEGFFYLVILAFIIGGAMLRDLNLLMVVAGIMLGLFLLNLWSLTRSMQRLQLERKCPDIVTVGDPLVVEISLSNQRRRRCSWAMRVDDSIRRSDATARTADQGKVFFPCVRPKQTARAAYHGRVLQRGTYELGPMRLTTRFPLGLMRRTKRFNKPGKIKVYPRPGELLPAWYGFAATTHVGAQRSRNQQGLMEGEFHGLRDWRSGDCRNWIHWRTTAKRGELTVRQFERHENQDVTLLADIQLDPDDVIGSHQRAELVIRFAATVAAEQCQRGNSRLFVGVSGQSARCAWGTASMITLHDVMELLSVAHASLEDRLPAALDTALTQSRPDTRIVIISTRTVDLSDTDRFSHAWGDLEKRVALGRISCVEISSPEVAQLIRFD